MKTLAIPLLTLGLASCAVPDPAVPRPRPGPREMTYPRKAEDVWDAAIGAARDLEIKVDAFEHDSQGGRVDARRPNGDRVMLEVRAVEPEMTSVSVRAESELTKLLFDRIAARLKARGSPTP